jgi:hypothetical protein
VSLLGVNNKAELAVNALLDGICDYASIAARFWSKVDKNGPVPNYKPELGPCWLWTGKPSFYGYGKFSLIEGISVGAHRVALALCGIRIPRGLLPDHLCRVRMCVRPTHLDFKTHRENILCGTAPSAVNARLVYCKRGHELSGINIYIYKGRRCCRVCKRDKMRIRRASHV